MRRLSLASWLLLFLSLIQSYGQARNPSPTPTPRPDEQEPVRIFTEEVRLTVAATDRFGHYDPSLELADVLVLEDGEQQQIRSIQQLPASVLLLLDVGNQLGLKDTKTTSQISSYVVAALHQGDRIAVMQFAERPQLLRDWTTDKDAVEKVLRTKLLSGKSSRLGDAIVAAANQFKDTTPGTRHIVLITDGVEAPGGKSTLAQSLKQLNSIQASVHIISYTVLARTALENRNKTVSKGDGVQRDGNPASNPVANGDPTLPPGTTRTPTFKIGSIDTDFAMRKKLKEYERATRESEKALTAMAEESGGQIMLPKSSEDLLAEAGEIARDIGSQCIVTYRPKRPLAEARPGEYRRVEVASRRVGLYLRTRRGYVVPGGP